MADPKEAAASAPAPAAPGGSNKIVMGVLGLNVVVMIAVAVVLMLGQKRQAQIQTLDQVASGANVKPAEAGEKKGEGKEGAKDAKAEGAPSDVHFFSLGDFVANLAGPASAHYVKVNVNFEVTKDADDEELKQRKPQFRDRVIALLNAKRPSDLESTEGRGYLKEEIKTAVNGFLQKGKVEGVYFSQFVIN